MLICINVPAAFTDVTQAADRVLYYYFFLCSISLATHFPYAHVVLNHNWS